MWWYPCLVAYLLSSLTVIQAELYTALADMEELLTTEVVLIRTLDQYIEAQEERLKMLKK
jgi:Prolyl 4-Hydroxylase alpha-subunit, N-terminal region.